MTAARTCSDCSTPISRMSKGRCKPCSARWLNSDPEAIARRRAAQVKFFARPEVKRDLAQRIVKASRNLTPEQIEARRAKGRRIAATILRRPDVAARSNSPEAKAKAGAGRTNTVLAWCPPEYRDRYRELKNRMLIRAPEARRMIEEEIAKDRQRSAPKQPKAPLSFAEQLERVRNGARVVDKVDTRRVDHDFTLGGIATGML